MPVIAVAVLSSVSAGISVALNQPAGVPGAMRETKGAGRLCADRMGFAREHLSTLALIGLGAATAGVVLVWWKP
jgi:hypothetical protein